MFRSDFYRRRYAGHILNCIITSMMPSVCFKGDHHFFHKFIPAIQDNPFQKPQSRKIRNAARFHCFQFCVSDNSSALRLLYCG